LLGIAPFIAHVAAALQQRNDRFDWIPNDLYLFVMVVGAAAAWETFRDQKSDGPVHLITGIIGVVALLIGAWAYGLLEVGTSPFNAVLKASPLRAITVVLTFYLWYKIPFIAADAVREAMRKGKRT
jgi:hypothetical protein